MSVAFISYSRHDKAFAGQLREAFANHQQDIWIDWQSIAPSQAWWEEIKQGIARANNFLLIMSPNSMSSPICQLEIEHARRLGKRIIPVMHIPYEREKVIMQIAARLGNPEQDATRAIWGSRQPHDVLDGNEAVLKHINYFFFSAEDNFEERFADLLKVVQMDFEHTEQHTKLLLRAQEWDTRERDAGFLLFDSELTDAETWLAASTQKVPAPSDLHRAFIQASRDAETKRAERLAALEAARRRARQTLIAVAILSVIFIVGALLFTTNQVNEAQNQVDIAETQAFSAENREATASSALATAEQRTQQQLFDIASRDMAETAQQLLQEEFPDPQLALAIALEAARLPNPPARTQEILSYAVDAAPRMRYSHDDLINSVALSPDGRFAVSGTGNDFAENLPIQMWNVETGEVVQLFEGHTRAIRSVVFSPDGQSILSGSDDMTLRLWDVESGEAILILEGHTDNVRSVAFSPDGTQALSGSHDNSIRLWDLETGETIYTFTDHTRDVNSVAFSPDGQLGVSGAGDTTGDNNTIGLWDLTTGELIQFFEHPAASMQSVAFSPDGQTVLSGSNDGNMYLWDVETGDIVRTFSQDTLGITSVAFSPDGQNLFAANEIGSVQVWARNDNRNPFYSFQGHNTPIASVAVSTDGKRALSGEWGTGANMLLWDIPLGDVIVKHEVGNATVAISPDGHLAASGGGEGALDLWDISTQEHLYHLEGHTEAIQSLAFSPTSQTLLSGSRDMTLRLWNLTNGQELAIWEGHEGNITSVAISPDGQLAASGSFDTTIRLWDMVTGETVHILEGGNVLDVAFGLDGQQLISLDSDGTMSFWDVDSGEQVDSIRAPFASIDQLVLLPDGEQLLLDGGFLEEDARTFRLWDFKEDTISTIFRGHTNSIRSVASSHDGQKFISSANDSTVRLWDAETGQTLQVFQTGSHTVVNLAFSPDGRTVIGGANDGTVLLWNIQTVEERLEWIEENRVFAELMCEDRARYNLYEQCD